MEMKWMRLAAENSEKYHFETSQKNWTGLKLLMKIAKNIFSIKCRKWTNTPVFPFANVSIRHSEHNSHIRCRQTQHRLSFRARTEKVLLGSHVRRSTEMKWTRSNIRHRPHFINTRRAWKSSPAITVSNRKRQTGRRLPCGIDVKISCKNYDFLWIFRRQF